MEEEGLFQLQYSFRHFALEGDEVYFLCFQCPLLPLAHPGPGQRDVRAWVGGQGLAPASKLRGLEGFSFFSIKAVVGSGHRISQGFPGFGQAGVQAAALPSPNPAVK